MMQQLPDTHPRLYEKFIHGGNHRVRRSDRYWAGLSTDLVIEQVMMWALKSRGGLTHGRGLSDSVRFLWVHSMHMYATVYSALLRLTSCENFVMMCCMLILVNQICTRLP
jgi:hypothetical protein